MGYRPAVSSRPHRPLRKLVIAVLFVLVASAGGMELLARWMQLDTLQYSAMYIADHLTVPTPAQRAAGVDYLPRRFTLDDDGFTTAYGRCSYTWSGRTLLVLGDSTTVQAGDTTSIHDIRDTWPLLVEQHLGPEWQLCVLAENGYHPADLAALWPQVQGPLQPDLTVLLLCDNDFAIQRHRVAVQDGSHYRLASPPERWQVWRYLWNPWLHRRSAAYRHFTWRMAKATGDDAWIAGSPDGRLPLPALQSLASLDPLAFYLPPVTDGAPVGEAFSRDSPQAPFDIAVIALPEPRSQYRRESDDHVHVNDEGHRIIARRVLDAIDARLDVDEHAAGDAG